MSIITIANDSERIKETNYWDSEYAEKGFFYLSWNAGVGRLLVPDSMIDHIAEMKTGKKVIIEKEVYQGRDTIVIVFDDGTETPYCAQIVNEMCDKPIISKNKFELHVWTRAGKQVSFNGKSI